MSTHTYYYRYSFYFWVCLYSLCHKIMLAIILKIY